jgi:AbiTii
MARGSNRGGLLAQIEAGVVDPRVPLSVLLPKCILLGGQARSEKMRDWARRELNGYGGADDVPDYRRVPAALMAMITNRAGYNGRAVRFDDSVFPAQIREIIREKVDLEEAILSHGIGQLEAMASEGTQDHQLLPPWAGFIRDTLNERGMVPNGRVADVYLSVPNVAVQGVLVRIRTALADLVAELIALTPQDQQVPDGVAADQATQFVITGDRNVINYSPQHATGSGTNVTSTGAGPAVVTGSQTASGAGASVAGTQGASGEGASVTGGQVVQAGRDAVVAGRDSNGTSAGPAEQPVKESWWTSLRKRGVVTTISIIVTAIAGVAAVVVTIMVAAGWKP